MIRSSGKIGAVALAGLIGMSGVAMADPGRMGQGPMRGSDIDFAAIDANSDSVLDRQELIDRATARLGEADANGDGNLDRAEIAAQMPDRGARFEHVFSEDRAEKRAGRILAMLGGTEAGQVSVAEMAEQRANMLLAFADEDQDGALSREEAEDRGKRGGRNHDHRGERHRGDGPRGEGPGGEGPRGDRHEDRAEMPRPPEGDAPARN